MDCQGVDLKAAEHRALEIYRKMIDNVRQKAAAEEKKEDDDLKKKEEVSQKLEDEKPGNLLVSVGRKVIKEEQSDSNMGVETDNKEGFKDVVKAADYFASRVGSGKGVDKHKIHKGKGKGDSLKEKTSQTRDKSKGNPKGNPKRKSRKSTKSDKKDGNGPKNVVSPGKTGEKNTSKGGKNNTGKSGSKGKKQRRQEWRQSMEGSKVTFTDVERLFMKLMRGANEEDWIFLANLNVMTTTRIYDHKISSVYNAESLPWMWRYILTRFNRKHILCGRPLPCADRARKCLDEFCWKNFWKHHFLEKVSETLPVRVLYQRTAVFNQLPCPSLRCWPHRLKSAVFSVLQEDRSRGKSSTAHVNTFPMIRWVLRCMRDGGWTLLPDNKEPGVCFIRPSEIKDVAISSLVPGLMKSRTSLICGSSLPNVLESCTVNEHNPLSCLCSGVKARQQSVRSGCVKQHEAVEK